jgi:hypothetical protein
MATPKDTRTRRLRALRRQALRKSRRAGRRRRRALRRGDKREARNALKVQRRWRSKAQQYLQDSRARRRSLRQRLRLKPKTGLDYFGGKQVAGWIVPFLREATKHGWDGRLSSGYRSYAKQFWIYYVARIRPAAKPGQSNHEGIYWPRGAIDTPSPWALRAALKKVGPLNGRRLVAYMDVIGQNDPWHFSARGN